MIYSQGYIRKTYIVDDFTLNLANVVRAGLRFLNHFHGNRGKDTILAALTAILILMGLIQVAMIATERVAANVLRHEKSIVI